MLNIENQISLHFLLKKRERFLELVRMKVRAILNYARISSRKVKIVLDLIKE